MRKVKKESAFADGRNRESALGFRFFCLKNQDLRMAVPPLAFGAVNDGFDDAVSHAQTDDIERIPETAVKYHVAGIPNPFKTERKHVFSSL
jgi:hypothetical protein